MAEQYSITNKRPIAKGPAIAGNANIVSDVEESDKLDLIEGCQDCIK